MMAVSDALQIAGLIVVALSGLAGIAVYLERKTVAVFNARLGTVDVLIESVRAEQREVTETTMAGLERIEALEVTINNGLTDRTLQTAADVDQIKQCQQTMLQQISEIHGWIKAKETVS